MYRRGLMDSRFQSVLNFESANGGYNRRLKGCTLRVMVGSINRSDTCIRGGNPPDRLQGPRWPPRRYWGTVRLPPPCSPPETDSRAFELCSSKM